MNRQPLNDGTGRYFDRDTARHFSEDTYHDGQNRISLATRSQWDHEELFCTAGGTWILHRWSQREGIPEYWRVLTEEEAASWLIEQDHEDAVPAAARQALEL